MGVAQDLCRRSRIPYQGCGRHQLDASKLHRHSIEILTGRAGGDRTHDRGIMRCALSVQYVRWVLPVTFVLVKVHRMPEPSAAAWNWSSKGIATWDKSMNLQSRINR